MHDSYEALVADESIDAVYIPLPNGLHAEWSLKCIDAGKHVLCEKPFTANAAEAELVAASAERAGVVVMEAFHWRYGELRGREGWTRRALQGRGARRSAARHCCQRDHADGAGDEHGQRRPAAVLTRGPRRVGPGHHAGGAVHDRRERGPFVMYLANRRCELTGRVFSIGCGHVAEVHFGKGRGWYAADLTRSTPEEVAAHLDAVCDPTGFIALGSGTQEFRVLAEHLGHGRATS